VQQIAPLRSLALNGDAKSGLDQISQMIAAGETKKLTIERSIPVYVLYWTAFVNNDGAVEFRPDVYERDSALLAALKGEHASRKAVAELGI
jgi:murein L,D-transpeptidase YcbB/YkuD